MRKSFTGFVTGVTVLTMFSGVAAAYDFSADVVSTQNKTEMKGKIFVSGDRSRMEMKDMAIIVRGDKKVSWVLMNDQKMYMENPITPGSVPVEKDPSQVEKVVVGKEKVDGKPATKYKVTLESGKQKTVVYQWFLDDSGFPVKSAALDGSWSNEFKNMKSGAQPASLFEIPAGFQKFSMPAMPSMPAAPSGAGGE